MALESVDLGFKCKITPYLNFLFKKKKKFTWNVLSALLHIGHVSGVDETICCHFTAFRKFCCCMCFASRYLAKLKT